MNNHTNGITLCMDSLNTAENIISTTSLRIWKINQGTYALNQPPLAFDQNTNPELNLLVEKLEQTVTKLKQTIQTASQTNNSHMTPINAPSLQNLVLRVTRHTGHITAYFFDNTMHWKNKEYPTTMELNADPELWYYMACNGDPLTPTYINGIPVNAYALYNAAQMLKENEPLPDWLQGYNQDYAKKPPMPPLILPTAQSSESPAENSEKPQEKPSKPQKTLVKNQKTKPILCPIEEVNKNKPKIKTYSQIDEKHPWPKMTGKTTENGNSFHVMETPNSKPDEPSGWFCFTTIENLPYILLYRKGQKFGFFDENLRWKVITKLYDENKKPILTHNNRRAIIPDAIEGISIDGHLFRLVRTTMQEGDTLDDFIIRYNFLYTTNKDIPKFNDTFHQHLKPRFGTGAPINKEVENFIAAIGAPSVERETANFNRKTFDFVRIRFSLLTSTKNMDRVGFINAHLTEFVKAAKWRIECAENYKQYGVPVDYLVLKHATITKQSELEMLFVPQLNQNKTIDTPKIEEQ